MKQVLLIDASPVFRDFLKEKLKTIGVQVETALSQRDAFPKLLSLMPDLIIVIVEEDIFDLQELLDKKSQDINVKSIPIIALGPTVDRAMLGELASYGIIKYFTKPIKIDLFFSSISTVFKSKIFLDTVPCAIDVHTNGNVIFIEISKGLNLDKLALLKYRLGELLSGEVIESPKVILLLSGVEFTFVDTPNIEQLIDMILKEKKVHRQNVKVITQDSFVTELIHGHITYENVEVTNYLPDVLNEIIDAGSGSDIAGAIVQKILLADSSTLKSNVDLRFSFNKAGNHSKQISIAVVDSDTKTIDYLTKVFATRGWQTFGFATAQSFTAQQGNFDLLIMDLFLLDMSGLEFLKVLYNSKRFCPILIYTQIVQKQAILAAMKLGAKSYLTKPQNPAILIQKAMSLLSI